tara:strand:+ start:864 stop:1007 length:144 start_codon:yes stop_codon:yes gene_type:complete
MLNKIKLKVDKEIKKKTPKRTKQLYRTQVDVGMMTKKKYEELTGEPF